MPLVQHRKTVRYLVRTEVDVEWHSRRWRVLVSDISLGGMFIKTTELLSVGAEFEANLFLEDPLQVRCVVRHVLQARGMGVEFMGLSDSFRQRLENILARLAEP